MQKNADVIIKLENVKKIFSLVTPSLLSVLTGRMDYSKHVVALDNINFEMREGEIIGYIGKNGAGKSTTIKLILGVLAPNEGKVITLGRNPFTERKKILYNIGAVFGNHNFFYDSIPAIHTFKYHKVIYEIDDETFQKRMNFLKELFELESLLNIPVRKLSLGQKLRLNIALMLLHKPKLLILDEPTIGLDIFNKQKVISILKKLNEKENVSIFLATNDMTDIERLAKRVLLIDKGKLISDQSLEKFMKQFGNYKHVQLMLNNIRNEKECEKIKKELLKYLPSNKERRKTKQEIKIERTLNSCRFKFMITSKKFHELLSFINKIKSKYDLEDFEIRNLSLEEVLFLYYENEI